MNLRRHGASLMSKRLMHKSLAMTGAMCPVLPVEPLRSRMVSGYGWRDRPSGRRMHYGIDIWARYGEPARAVLPGIVETVTENGQRGFSGYGHVVVIRHNDTTGLRSMYAHLKTPLIEEGQSVNLGQTIGEVGNTNGRGGVPSVFVPGTTRNTHLHFEITRKRYPKPYGQDNVDPLEWFGMWNIGVGSGGNWIVPENYCSSMETQPPTGLPSSSPTRPTPGLRISRPDLRVSQSPIGPILLGSLFFAAITLSKKNRK